MSKGQISKCIRHLGYDSFSQFKDDCIAYKDSLTRKKMMFDPERDLASNVVETTQRYVSCLDYTVRNMDYGRHAYICMARVKQEATVTTCKEN